MLSSQSEIAINYFSQHVMLNSMAHAAAGFGIALVLQHYLKGNTFIPYWIGWALIGLSLAIHILPFI